VPGKRNRRTIIIVGVIIVAVLVAGAIANSGGDSSSDGKGSASGKTKIGVIVGASGQYAVVGENYTRGAQLAQEVWAEEHPEDKVELVVEDDGFNPQKGLAAYQKLTGVDKIDALLNMTSPTIDSIYSTARRADLPITQGGEQGIEPADDNVFQILPGNMATEVALGKHVKDKGHKKVAVFYGNSGVYVRFLAGFKEGYAAPVQELGIAVDDRDYRSHVTKALAEKPDAFVFLTTPEQGANLIKLIKEQGGKDTPLFLDASAQSGFPDYQRILGSKGALDGATMVVVRQTFSDDFAKRYKAKYDADPGVASDWAYDSFTLLMQTRADTRKKWLENMKAASFEGAGGKVEFDDAGVRVPDFVIGPIEAGKLPQ
jgi:branched-chain amino acid transport system substrate-binding protein